MLNSAAIDYVKAFLQADDFYRQNHRKIFTAIIDQATASPVDLITVAEELRRRGQLEEVGTVAYLTALIEACPSSASFAQYATIVHDMAQRRARLNGEEAP